jgi:uncharacterized glyoxalase superfamily protein PhnB
MLPNVEKASLRFCKAQFSGPGVVLSIDVDDVDAQHEKLRVAGALNDVVDDLRDEPWGQRHFLFRDPAGILLDVLQMIPPNPEYAAAYSGESGQCS